MFDIPTFISERTHDFTGREWVFDKIDRWLADPAGPPFFIITGEPGIGKTAIAARLTQLRAPAAYHFCVARQAASIDPLNFVRSISHQLTRIDDFARLLLQDQGVNVQVEINIRENYGQVIGVKIENLVIQALSAVEAFQRGVLDPLGRLFAAGYANQVWVLVDALDEADQHPGPETIVELLASAGGLPAGVHFTVTTRPEPSVLRHFERAGLPHLLLDAGREENRRDIRAYIQRQLDASASLQSRLSEKNLPPERFKAELADASRGNFLYLVWLLPAVASGAQSLDDLSALPAGLDGIYREFLRTRMLGKDLQRWRERYRPFLGVLAAAQAPLSAGQLTRFTHLSPQEVDDLVVEVGQFLAPGTALAAQAGKEAYQLYHQSIPDFLRDKQRAGEFWIDLAAMHQRIANAYRGPASSWTQVDWRQVDDYGLAHLAGHLYALREVEKPGGGLFGLICKPFMEEKLARTHSHRSFANDVLLSIQTARAMQPPSLAQEIRGSLLHATLGSLATNIPPAALVALVEVGQGERATGYAALIQDRPHQCQAYLDIAAALSARGQPEAANQALDQAMAAAQSIEDPNARDVADQALTASLAEAGRLKDAIEIARLVVSPRPRTLALSTVSRALSKAGDRAGAGRLAQEALSASLSYPKGLELSEILVAACQALADADLFDQALRQAAQLGSQDNRRDLTEHWLRWHAHTGIAAALLKASQTQRAAETAAQVVSEITTIPDDRQSWIGFFEDEAYFDKNTNALYQANALAGLALALSQVLKSGEGFSPVGRPVVADLPGRTPRQTSGQAESQDPYEALAQTVREAALLAVAKAKVRGPYSFQITSGAFNLILNPDEARLEATLALIAIGDLPEASKAVEGIANPYTKIEALVHLADALDQAGDLQEARQIHQEVDALADRIVQDANTAQTAREKLDALSSAASWMDWLDRPEQAAELAGQAKEAAANMPRRQDRAEAMADLAHLYIELGDEALAENLANTALGAVNTVRADRAKPEMLAAFAVELAKAGEKAEALKAANLAFIEGRALGSRLDRVVALVAAAKALAEAGDGERAADSAGLTMEEAQQIKRLQDRAEALLQASRAWISVGDLNKAISTAEQALEAIDQIKGARRRALLLGEASYILAAAGAPERAVSTAELALKTTRNIRPREKALTLIGSAQALLITGAYQKGLDTLGKALALAGYPQPSAAVLQDPGEKAEVLGRAAQALLEAGDRTRAEELALQANSVARQASSAVVRAARLGEAARLLVPLGKQAQVLPILQSALETARQVGREAILAALRDGAPAIASAQPEQSLSEIFQALLEVETWWE